MALQYMANIKNKQNFNLVVYYQKHLETLRSNQVLGFQRTSKDLKVLSDGDCNKHCGCSALMNYLFCT